MHIINGFIRLTKLSYRHVKSACCWSCDHTAAARTATTTTEQTSLLIGAVGETTTTDSATLSFTDEYEDFSHSWKAVRLCLFHVVVYYLAAVLGFSCGIVATWPVIDSLYFATVVWTTIGYGDLKPESHAAMFYTIGLAMYGIVLLGIFLGIAGEAVVDAYSDSLEKRHKKIGSRVLNALLVASTRNSGDSSTSSSSSNNNRKSTAITNTTTTTNAVAAATNEHEETLSSDSDSDDEQTENLLREILNVVVLEVPIFLIVIALAMLVGRSEGWDWQVSIYYTVVSGTTIGFGDYSPTHATVRLACCFLLPLMVAVLGEFLARIASIYMNRQSRQAEQRFMSRSLTLGDLERMDINQDGVVEKGEFLAFMLVALQKVSQDDVNDIWALFNHLDRDKNGTLTKNDLIARDWNRQFRTSLLPGRTTSSRAAAPSGNMPNLRQAAV